MFSKSAKAAAATAEVTSDGRNMTPEEFAKNQFMYGSWDDWRGGLRQGFNAATPAEAELAKRGYDHYINGLSNLLASGAAGDENIGTTGIHTEVRSNTVIVKCVSQESLDIMRAYCKHKEIPNVGREMEAAINAVYNQRQ